MASGQRAAKRLLAIDFSSRGFGFVVFDGPQFLIDWGVVHLKAREAEAAVRRIETLLKLYRPHEFVVEDIALNPRRSRRVQNLARVASLLAVNHGVRATLVPAACVRKFFAVRGATTKHQIAIAIAAALPEIAPRLPPKRKPWMSEGESMSIFDAAAMVCTVLREIPRRSLA